MGSSTLKRIDVIFDPQARVGMVRSLHLDEHLNSADIEPERGELNALLASNDIVGDGPDVYDATRSLDWATREALIASSIAFVDYVTAELVAAENDSRIVRSDRLGEHVKTKVVSQIAQIGADIGAVPSPQSIAFRRRRSVGVTAIHGSGFLSLFHAEVTRDGPFWSIGVPEIGESITTAERSEIADKAHELISSHTGLRDDDIRVVVCSERDSVRACARKLGFK